MSYLINVVDSLNRIDWDFPSAKSQNSSIHSTHWFPGNFIPQIPAHLIQVLSHPGQVVFDPFGGSGTTAIEALRLGRNAISSDIVSACVFIGDSKLKSFSNGYGHDAAAELLADLTWSYLCETDEIGSNGEGGHSDLSIWFSPSTLRQLRFLWKKIEAAPEIIRPVFELVFSDVLFACASTGGSQTSTGKIRRHHWGWVADNVSPATPNTHDAIALFRERLVGFINISRPSLKSDLSFNFMKQDARALALKNASVDLIITSPPYIGVIDYTRANRLLYMWRGWDFDKDRSNEIGARYKRARKDVKNQYINDMLQCWQETARVLKPGGFCGVIIGESRRFPGTAERTMLDLNELMPIIWGPVGRSPTRRRVSDRMASDAIEYVSVFQKK